MSASARDWTGENRQRQPWPGPRRVAPTGERRTDRGDCPGSERSRWRRWSVGGRPRRDVRHLADQPDRDLLGALAEPDPHATGADDDLTSLRRHRREDRDDVRPAVRAGERHAKRRRPESLEPRLPAWKRSSTLPVEPISFRPGNLSRSVLRAGSARYENVRPVQGSGRSPPAAPCRSRSEGLSGTGRTRGAPQGGRGELTRADAGMGRARSRRGEALRPLRRARGRVPARGRTRSLADPGAGTSAP